VTRMPKLPADSHRIMPGVRRIVVALVHLGHRRHSRPVS